jgi:multiple sugar transport system permease protein
MRRAGFALALTLVIAWSTGPVVWQFLTAIKTDAQITHSPVVYWPHPATSEHFRAIWERKPFGIYLLNSTFIALFATILCLLFAAPAGMALARLRPRDRDAVLLTFLVLSLFPPILLLFPLYEAVRGLGWINQPVALVIPYAALHLPLAVWVLESGFRAIPLSIEEAARLDGLSAPSRLLRVQAPLAAPALATAAILVFIFAWNEFMLAVTFLTRDQAKTVTAGIASVSGASLYEIPWGPLCAAITLATFPLFVLVLVFQRRIVSGLTRGAVKG